ncbi:DUF6680 family protein [Stenotrophomonas maltophilia]|uniref:DUF6680 family protein n=1 Tax=Stenotrophomonas maltophilia TaxID=40324 RepID=UPI0030F478EB
MTVSDWMIVCATLAGPIIAVQVQKAVEAARDSRNRKSWVFHQLMSTRAARVSAEHVQALNMIDLAFYGKGFLRKRTAREQLVLDRWREYHDHLADHASRDRDEIAWFTRGDELFVNLLEPIATDVGYRFDRVQLRKGIYSPEAHSQLEAEQHRLRRLAIDVLSGQQPLQMNVIGFPIDDDAMKAQSEMTTKIASIIDDGKLQIAIANNPQRAPNREPVNGQTTDGK